MGNWNANLRTSGPTKLRRRNRLGWRAMAVGVGVLGALGLAHSAAAQAPTQTSGLTIPSDEQSYRREFVFGINFNTQGALVGGASLRSAKVLDERWLRFWSLEGVMLKNRKELPETTRYGGSYIRHKVNHAFALRPSFGMQRVLFRKAADSGVQVNALLSAGPTLGLLMPYYISYDRTPSSQQNSDPQYYRDEPYDPAVHQNESLIVDRSSLFAGIGKTKIVPGAHLRAALSFEYGRYRDAVAGIETGFVVESFTQPIVILKPNAFSTDRNLSKQFFPSVYLTLYFGHRS